MGIAVVILNFNDASSTLSAAERALSFRALSAVVVVDNASADTSFEILTNAFQNEEPFREAFLSGRLHLLETGHNGGYGCGNNFGVRFAYGTIGASYCLIANPDSIFDETLVESLVDALSGKEDIAAAGAVMGEASPGGGFSYDEYTLSGWKERGFWEALLYSGPLMKRIARNFINYPFSYYEGQKESVEVFAVHGSLLMVNAEYFLEAGGFDEEVFLYEEENILAKRLKATGKKTCLLKKGYTHLGSRSISGTGLSAYERQSLRRQSELLYYRKYLGIGNMKYMIAKCFSAIVLLETKLFL